MKLAVPSSFELGSGRGEASGCISGVLHRILCRNLRDKRFTDKDEVFDWRKVEQGKSEAVMSANSSPGIVARLMGLESMPAFPYAQPETISRTRSANSAESWKGPGLLCEQRSGSAGSELRKSQSFREVRSYLRKESEEFLVLSFGDYDESDELELSTKKMDFGFEQYGKKESRGERKLVEKRSRNKSMVNSAEINHTDAKSFSASEKGMMPNEITERSSSCRKKISFGHVEMEMECSSQNSSPISVLDLPLDAEADCIASPDSSTSVCKIPVLKSEEKDSRKKASLAVENESKKASKCGLVVQDLSDILAHICRLGEDDLHNSKWVKAKMDKSEEAEEIGFVVGQDIFEILMNEAVFDMFN
ncbi:uncharacterized protein LOC110105026 [Dendrobium catenatum]|uniref:DUF3741 domain-containing protein n=1 Tax=Dendrobium catenatum TaxID=906689 RepID=A0A2I0XEQ9_9ASPA|nr:uncharacterized protein LOC110105026 [Dendrobium catenatum]PKU86408.1 hypothetical protein MA16_Dca013344 [Dendrobium catenatum]